MPLLFLSKLSAGAIVLSPSPTQMPNNYRDTDHRILMFMAVALFLVSPMQMNDPTK